MGDQLKILAVLMLGVSGSVWDVWTRRVPNVLTFGASGLALIFSTVHQGVPGLTSSALGLLTGLAVMFPLFALGGMGAGDVKFLAAFGAWMGPVGALWTALWGSLIGGIMALAVAASRGSVRQTLGNVGTLIGVWRHGSLAPVPGFTLADSSSPRLAYALPIAAGAFVTLWRG